MDALFWTETIPSIALGIGLAACAGIRAWLPLLLAGGLARFDVIELGQAFQFISSTRALVLFGVATVVEIAADKIPAVDHALDAMSTFLRPAAASLLAASVMWRVEDPLTALAMGVAVGAPTSFVPHMAKSGLRVASTALTGGIANPIVSVVEDVLAVAIFIVTVVMPVLAAAAILLLALFVARRLARRSRPVPSPA